MGVVRKHGENSNVCRKEGVGNGELRVTLLCVICGAQKLRYFHFVLFRNANSDQGNSKHVKKMAKSDGMHTKQRKNGAIEQYILVYIDQGSFALLLAFFFLTFVKGTRKQRENGVATAQRMQARWCCSVFFPFELRYR